MGVVGSHALYNTLIHQDAQGMHSIKIPRRDERVMSKKSLTGRRDV
jgi:hypothetical protein